MKIKLLTNQEFLEFSKHFRPSSLYQTSSYAFVMNNQKCESVFVGLYDGDILKAAGLVLIQKINGFKYGSVPRGFLIDYNNKELLADFTRLLKKFLGKKEVVALKVNPPIVRFIYDDKGKLIFKSNNYNKIFKEMTDLGYFHLGYNNYFEALKPRFEARIRIDKPEDALYRNIDKGYQRKIKKAINDGVKVYHGGIDDLKYLYEQTKDNYPRGLKYFYDLYKFYEKDNNIDFYYSKLDTTDYLKHTQKMYSIFSKKSHDLANKLIGSNGRNYKLINKKLHVDKKVTLYRKQLAEATDLLRLYPDGIVISSALIIKWQDEAYMLINGYDDNYRKFSANHLMMWQLLCRYSKLGFTYFNFGGVSNVTLPKNEYKGLNEFKMNFGSEVLEYAGDFELITNRPLYFVYKNSFGISDIFK